MELVLDVVKVACIKIATVNLILINDKISEPWILAEEHGREILIRNQKGKSEEIILYCNCLFEHFIKKYTNK